MLGLITMGCVGIIALTMAHFENMILDLIGYAIMTALAIGCVWYILDKLNTTFFF